ncbi:MAG: helix-turn-helix transcriptional regulator [Oscillospiraceae bacterium]|jgi:transcriptional regulator with XRE-family HTH domain|nr:helix-turn-helix transcriptional regulator [Oscillospiraceae bacterium]
MDQVRVGKYIASLRKQASLTQEELGEKLGVTNKTVSRWENGNYMPDIEMLQLLSKVFDVGINDLLAGEKIADEDFRQKAEENIIEVATSSAFSFEDRKVYFKRKWRKEHIALFVILGLILIASAVIPLIIDKLWLISFSPVIALIEYGYQNNRMMIYVENQLYH